jgi:hypothetical protein
MEMVETAPGAPPLATRERFRELEGELEGIVEELDSLLAEELPQIEGRLEAMGAPRIVLEASGGD